MTGASGGVPQAEDPVPTLATLITRLFSGCPYLLTSWTSPHQVFGSRQGQLVGKGAWPGEPSQGPLFEWQLPSRPMKVLFSCGVKARMVPGGGTQVPPGVQLKRWAVPE